MNLTDWATKLQESVMMSASVVFAFVPKVLGAVFLLLLGYGLGKLVGFATGRLLALLGFDRLLARSSIPGVLERAGTRKPASHIVGVLAFWIVFLLFLISATETLGLARLSEALTSLAYYLPKLGVATLIVVLGLIAANFVRELIIMACRTAGIAQGAILGQSFHVAAILLIFVTAINQLGVDTTLLNTTLVILVAGIIGGSALSFGLGARSAVANLIAAHYLQPVLRVGQKVHSKEFTGEVVAVTPVAIILDTEQGRVVVPASHFMESVPTITGPEKA